MERDIVLEQLDGELLQLEWHGCYILRPSEQPNDLWLQSQQLHILRKLHELPVPTSVSKGGLTTYFTWNGIGGRELTAKDASGNTTTYGYESCSSGAADPLWRVVSVTDPLGYEACKTYASGSSPDTVSTSFSFNSGNSALNTTATTDGYGREINVQKQQGPSCSLSLGLGAGRNHQTTSPSMK